MTTKLITILITPSQTLIGDEIIKPDNIAVVLENGHAYDIDDVIDILTVHDRKKPSKLRIKRRIQNFTSAFKAALKETDEQQSDPHYVITPPLDNTGNNR